MAVVAVPSLTPSAKGAIAEAEVVVAAIRLGLSVWRPVVEGQRYDLVVELGGRLSRVRVKWARRRDDVIAVKLECSRHTPNGYVRTKYGADEIDVVAAYCPDNGRCYLLPIELVADRREVSLRLAPARNNQETGVHWARNTSLGL